MAKKKIARYVANNKLPQAWVRLLELGDFFRLARVVEEDGKANGMSVEDHERFRENGRIDPVELGIAAFSLVCIVVAFVWLR